MLILKEIRTKGPAKFMMNVKRSGGKFARPQAPGELES